MGNGSETMGDATNMGGTGDGVSGDAAVLARLPAVLVKARELRALLLTAERPPGLLAADGVDMCEAIIAMAAERERLTRDIRVSDAMVSRATRDLADARARVAELEAANARAVAVVEELQATTVTYPDRSVDALALRARVAELEADLGALHLRHRETVAAFDAAAPDALRAFHKRQVDAQSLNATHGAEMAEMIRAALRRKPVAGKEDGNGDK